ncbi:hypothetical protein ABIB25_001077 [Nakamurella sp. UYEF19]|uniref:hypothetical protein n=1 Tax=Nakamurella sp. UYEF19 TaxID=1756392 RepID=UPI003394C0A2
MGFKDILKSMRGGEKKGDLEDAGDTDAPEPTWFQPRYDGNYRAEPEPGSGLSLRFLPGGKVFESATEAAPGPEQQNPCRGEYTAAGRFNVQRQFERIISYAILEMQDDGFLARRINGADRTTIELLFTFSPDLAD